MKWVKDDQAFGISQGTAEGYSEPVWDVDLKNIEYKDLPIEAKTLVPVSDKDGYERLCSALSNWAERKGFKMVEGSVI